MIGDGGEGVIGEVIPPALSGERLDRIVSMVSGASRAAASILIELGEVTVDGVVVTSRSYRVREGQNLGLPAPARDKPVRPQPDSSVEVRIVHCDDDVIVVDKQAGVVVHPGAGNLDQTLVNGLLALFPELSEVGDPERPGIVHRLDKETSGLMLVARSSVAYEGLVAALAAHQVERRYLGLLWGTFDATKGVVDAPIGRSTRTRTKMAVSVGGREARTAYEVLRTFTDPVEMSLVAFQLETGRTHQIRVHMAAIGHPVVGDQRYRGVREAFTVPRTFLHSTRLEFGHPVTGERMQFDSPLPSDLQDILAGLG